MLEDMTTVAPNERVTPNDALRAVRISMRMSQDEFARALRRAGEETDDPNDASKRLCQRWESGVSRWPRSVYARALERVTGLPVEALGFVLPVPLARVTNEGGHSMASETSGGAAPSPYAATATSVENYAGVWLSSYEFYSSGRNSTFTSRHYVVLVQHGGRITGRSLSGASDSPGSSLALDLTLDRNVITGTWSEETARDGYYRGAKYHGAIQMIIEPTGRRMVGKWAGFGKELEVNTGPWSLVFQAASTSEATLRAYSVPPE